MRQGQERFPGTVDFYGTSDSNSTGLHGINNSAQEPPNQSRVGGLASGHEWCSARTLSNIADAG
jgi:hypothetical protein